VVTVIVAVEILDPFRLIEVGEIEQLASNGAPLQASDSAPVNPAIGVKPTEEVEVCPARTVSVVGEGEREKSARVTESCT
jgi:hypothetical protein